MRVVIIEDEAATRRMLQSTIEQIEPDVQVVTLLDNVASSVAWFQENTDQYDLVFMDIRLNDGVSLDIFKQVEIKSPVIFVTAYDDYALDAFNTNGISYVLKPFDSDQIEQALNKYKKLVKEEKSSNVNTSIEAVLHALNQQKTYKESFLIHVKDKMIPLKTDSIAWIQTESEMCTAYTFDGKYFILDGTLEKIMEDLNPKHFFRANRQYIIHKNAVDEVHFYFNGRLLLHLKPTPDDRVLISKAKASEFKNWMNQ